MPKVLFVSRESGSEELLARLEKAGFVKEDASDLNYVFWLGKAVSKETLKEAAVEGADVELILKRWEETRYKNAKGQTVGKTTEVVTEKFEMDNSAGVLLNLLDGNVAVRKMYDTKICATPKIGLDENGKIVIYIGGSKIAYVSDTDQWQPLLKEEDGKEFLIGTIGETKLHALEVQMDGKSIFLLGFGDDEYYDETREKTRKTAEVIIDEAHGMKRIGIEIPSLLSKELFKPEDMASSAKMIDMNFDAEGNPVLAYAGKQLNSLEFATLNIKCEAAEEDVLLYINGASYRCAKSDWGKDVLIVNVEWTKLSQEPAALQEKVIPGSRINFVEGVGVAANKEANKRMIIVEVRCDNKIRFYRIARRGKGQKGKENMAAELERRFLMQYTEEPFIHRWAEGSQFSITAMSLEESLFVLDRIGWLDKEEVLTVVEKLGFADADEFKSMLHRIVLDTVKEKIEQKDWYSKGKILSYVKKPVFIPSRIKTKLWIFLRKKIDSQWHNGFLRKIALALADLLSPEIHMNYEEFFPVGRYHQGIPVDVPVDEGYFDEFCVPFFEYVSLPLGGGILVPRVMMNLENAKEIPTNDKAIPFRKTKKMVARHNTARSLLHDLVRLRAAGDLPQAKLDLVRYVNLRRKMSGRIVDLDGNLGNYNFRQIVEDGEKILELNKAYHLTANPLRYEPSDYSWEKIMLRRIPMGEFEDAEVLDALMKDGILKVVEGYPYYVYFDPSIENEDGLKTRIANALPAADASAELAGRKVVEVWHKYPRLEEWPELKEFYEGMLIEESFGKRIGRFINRMFFGSRAAQDADKEELRETDYPKLPASKFSYFLTYLKQKLFGEEEKSLETPFDYDVIDKSQEKIKERVEESRVRNIMYELFLQVKAENNLTDTESFLVWLDLLKFVFKKDEPELVEFKKEEPDFVPVLEGLYERAYNEPGIIESGEWEIILEKMLSEAALNDLFQRLRVDIRLFQKAVPASMHRDGRPRIELPGITDSADNSARKRVVFNEIREKGLSPRMRAIEFFNAVEQAI
ncbi:MAG: hypothetical protein L6366_00710 [Candidatus Omnitrophica bacterium]|nr:hypothetical protein [Candidatus Omnitrophota bacterium]